MQGLKRFLRLPGRRRSLVIQAFLAILIVRLTLAFLSLQAVQRLVVSVSRGSDEVSTVHQIVWAMGVVIRLMPGGAACLVQALAAQALLVRHGYNSRLTIGVAKDECDGFGAHAWVTCEDRIVVGDHERGNYTALLSFES